MIVYNLCVSLRLHIISHVAPEAHMIHWRAITRCVEVHSLALMGLDLAIVGPDQFLHK